MKTFGFAALVAIAALVLGFGARLTAPTAHADATGVSSVGCEFLASAQDGDTTNAVVPGTDYPAVCNQAITPAQIQNFADTLGDKDGVLEQSDLAAKDGFDGNQLGAGCTAAGFGCTIVVFAFVNDEAPVTFDPSSHLVTIENATINYVCNAEGASPGDNDCTDTTPNNGDGVVTARVLAGAGAVAGDVEQVNVEQEGVTQSFDVNIVGTAHNVDLTLAETTVQSTGSNALFTTCLTTNDVTDSTSLSQPESTIAIAVVTDADGTKMTRVPVGLASDHTDIADIATGSTANEILGNTGITVDAGTSGVAQFAVICGGKTTGTAVIKATINATLTNEDTSKATITVVGKADKVALTAAPAQIACDGSQTSSVTAKVTDSAGNNVADGTDVTFSVVALGTSNPIKVKTVGGSASSTITPLSGSTAGVTVVVTAGDAQSSIRVDCSLPIPPTAVPAGAAPTPKAGAGGTIGGPDTGNGGYLGQNGSAGFPMWTLVALALGSVALVAGGMVTRRAGK